MSTASLVIDDNQNGVNYTADLNSALAAVNSMHSGASAPTDDLVAGKLWLDTTTTTYEMNIYYSGWRPLFEITSGGLVNMSINTVTGANVNTTSDINIKSDVHTIENATYKTMQLRGVTYYNALTGNNEIGVIAQEVEEVIPQVVNSQGKYKTVAYGNLVGLLIETVKELNERITDLEKKLETKSGKRSNAKSNHTPSTDSE